MSRSYSLSFLTVQEASPVEAVEIAAACGYDFVACAFCPPLPVAKLLTLCYTMRICCAKYRLLCATQV